MGRLYLSCGLLLVLVAGLGCPVEHTDSQPPPRYDGGGHDATAADGAAADLVAVDTAAADMMAIDTALADGARPDSARRDAGVGRDLAHGDAGVAMSLLELCAVYESYFENGEMCVAGHVGTGLDFDADDLAYRCRPGSDGYVWAEALSAAAAAGRLFIDWDLARDCLAQSRALRQSEPGYSLPESPDWQALQQGVCHDFYKGLVAAGDPCQDDWECQAGLRCTREAPFEANGARCRPPSALGQACDELRTCAEGLYCAPAGTCAAQGGPGAACDPNLYGEDCTTGECLDSGQCAAAPPGPGQPCAENDTCAGDCYVCRPQSAGSPLTCRQYGARGDYCRDWYDCLFDLGCSGHLCGTVGEGETCGQAGEDQNLCDPGLYCLPQVDCSQHNGDATGCQAAAPTCTWDDFYAECAAASGVCTASLPSSGPCLYGQWCGAGTYCAPASTTCQPQAGAGQACDDEGQTAPLCLEQLSCVEGLCTQLCEINQDCPADHYCSPEQTCAPFARDSCTASYECPDDQYCLLPEDVCAGYTDQGSCGGNSACQWIVQDLCEPVSDCFSESDSAACDALPGCSWASGGCTYTCYMHDADAAGCTATAGCVYDSVSAYCDPICESLLGEPFACGDEPLCQPTTQALCVLIAGDSGSCEPKRAIGQPCESAEQCASDECLTDSATGTDRCAVAASGCFRDAAYLRAIFLMGGVFFAVRLGQRRRER